MKQLGRYTLESRIATGGMAEIWLARAGETVVALKTILPHLNAEPEYRALFLEEIRVAARLHHPNIVHVHEMGETDGRPWLAMEYLDGRTLHRCRDLPHGVVAFIGTKVAAALDHAHRLRDGSGRSLEVVHRDVGDDNVMVTIEGDVKLIDFGVARAPPGVMVGRPRYYAPELVEGAPPSASTDQFALGVMLWEHLTGSRLFRRGGNIAELEAVRACVVPPTGAAERLDGVVRRALAKDPALRWPDCGAFALALEDGLLEAEVPAGAAELAAAVRRLREPPR